MPENDGNSRAGIVMGTDKNDVWVDHIRYMWESMCRILKEQNPILLNQMEN